MSNNTPKKKEKIETPEPVKEVAQPVAAPTKVTSLEVLQKFCEQKQSVIFDFRGKEWEIEVRSLTPEEDSTLEEILNSVLPPVIRGQTQEQDRHDYSNAEYVKKKAAAEIKARALGLYLCVPIFSKDKPGMTDSDAIKKYVQSQFNEKILHVLWQAIREGGVGRASLVNFT